jgi:hypothetical protein
MVRPRLSAASLPKARNLHLPCSMAAVLAPSPWNAVTQTAVTGCDCRHSASSCLLRSCRPGAGEGTGWLVNGLSWAATANRSRREVSGTCLRLVLGRYDRRYRILVARPGDLVHARDLQQKLGGEAGRRVLGDRSPPRLSLPLVCDHLRVLQGHTVRLATCTAPRIHDSRILSPTYAG